MDNTRWIQVALEFWGAFITIVCMAVVILGREYEPKKSRLLSWMLLVCTVLLVMDALAWVSRGDDTLLGNVMTRVSNCLVFLTFPILAIIVEAYFEELLHILEVQVNVWFRKILRTVASLHILLILFSQFTNFLYYFDEDNFYHRTPFFVITSVFGMILLVVLSSEILYNYKKVYRYEALSVLAYVLLPFLSNLIQMFVYGLSLNTLAMTMSILLVFFTYQVQKSKFYVDQNRLIVEHEVEMANQELALAMKEEELADKRIQIAMSQIRPHFMFNVLGSIEQLCKKNSDKAGEAVHYFARYLKTNMESLNKIEVISIKEELEHVRSYVWLEKMRFGDDICFQEIVETENFTIPSLTIQPLVENAIKYGMGDIEEGILRVTLHTWETEEENIITVSDDGCGFDVNAPLDTSRYHVGLHNVKERIRLMMRGSVEVRSEIGVGTDIIIRIPKDEGKQKS